MSRYVGLLDAQGGPVTRFTFDENSTDPVWTPDGTRVAFASNREGPANLYWKPLRGSGEVEPLLVRIGAQYPHSFSSDGRYLAFYEVTPTSGRDIWVLTVDGSEPPEPLVQTQFNERMPSVSPSTASGRWFAYVSNEDGTDEAYVERFPRGGTKQKVSFDGGRGPVWTGNGHELFYAHRGEVWSREVVSESDSTITFGPPQLRVPGLEERSVPVNDSGSRFFDVSSDGMRVYSSRDSGPQAQSQLALVQNFFEELKERMGSN